MLSWLLNLGRTFLGAITHLFANGDPYVPVPTLEESCVCFYKMNDNETSTVVLDSSGNGYNGTSIRNTNLMHVDGIGGGALSFNGSSDYIDTGQNFESTFRNSFTITLWSNLKNLIQSDDILGLYNPETGYIIRLFRDYTEGYLYFYYGNQTTPELVNLEAYYAPHNNRWVMITVVIEKTGDTSSGRIYMNGSEISDVDHDSTFNMENFSAGLALFLIGTNDYNNKSTHFNGSIDNVMIFNKALSQEEIWTLYNSGRGTEDFQLTPNLNFDGSALIMEGI
jgi:hypothetical protein